MFHYLIGLIVLLFFSFYGFGQKHQIHHQFKGQIIRSSTESNGVFLVGLKGKEKGDGKVYYSNTSDWQWQNTNDGLALDENTEDVQTVAILNDSTFLAGTWKNGLFRTENNGKSWNKVEDFPSKDIRSIKICPTRKELIYAATTTHGILKSSTGGRSWETCSHDSLFQKTAAWSIEVDPTDESIIYALTFGGGILKTVNQGKTWSTILEQKGLMFYDLHIDMENADKMWTVASGDSTGVMYSSSDHGKTWAESEFPNEIQPNSIVFSNESVRNRILGSWNLGAFIYIEGEWSSLKEIAFETISNVHFVNDEIVIATWGDGLFRFKAN